MRILLIFLISFSVSVNAQYLTKNIKLNNVSFMFFNDVEQIKQDSVIYLSKTIDSNIIVNAIIIKGLNDNYYEDINILAKSAKYFTNGKFIQSKKIEKNNIVIGREIGLEYYNTNFQQNEYMFMKYIFIDEKLMIFTIISSKDKLVKLLNIKDEFFESIVF